MASHTQATDLAPKEHEQAHNLPAPAKQPRNLFAFTLTSIPHADDTSHHQVSSAIHRRSCSTGSFLGCQSTILDMITSLLQRCSNRSGRGQCRARTKDLHILQELYFSRIDNNIHLLLEELSFPGEQIQTHVPEPTCHQLDQTRLQLTLMRFGS